MGLIEIGDRLTETPVLGSRNEPDGFLRSCAVPPSLHPFPSEAVPGGGPPRRDVSTRA